MSYADLYQAIPASLAVRGHKPVRATLGLFWSNLRPSEIACAIRAGDNYETWNVGRATFIAANQEWARGAWLGGGWFACCYAGDRIMLGFRPPRQTQAVVIAPATPVAEFIDHTTRLVPPGQPEEDINIERLDAALERILGGQQ